MWGREPVLWMGLILAIFLVAKEVATQAGLPISPSLDVALEGLAVAITAFVTRQQVTPNKSVGLRIDPPK